jgi:hypothetical protein
MIRAAHFDARRDSEKTGQSGTDVPAPREALYSCMRERGNGTDGLESPEIFRTKCGVHSRHHHYADITQIPKKLRHYKSSKIILYKYAE